MKKAGLVLVSALALASALLAPGALGAGSGPTVTLSIKTLTKTLLRPTAEHGEKGWITKGGTPRGKCSGKTAAGALDVATHGRWTGKYYSSVGGIFVTSIMGVKPKGSDFWELVVNGKVSSKGECGVKLTRGERLLFKIAK
jgi:Domain of unknown function (DUF4430)